MRANMEPFFWILLLIFINFPVLIFLIWLVFDDVRNARGDFLWGVFKALLSVFSIGAFSKFFVEDDDSSFINSILVLFVYGMVVAGEFWLISQYLPNLVS